MKGKFFKHLKLVTKHRLQVFKLCCKCGFFWRGLVHDLSKFSKTEFGESIKYYTGHNSPIENCRAEKGYSLAWIHHKNRNKHHLEYWYDKENEVQMNMPFKYAVECVCDKITATKCYNGKNYTADKVLEHWQTTGSLAQTNDRMRAFFTKVFSDLIERGEKEVLKKKYLKQVYTEVVLGKK